MTDNKKVKRVYIRAIDDYFTKSLTPIFEEHINVSAKVITDKWRGYEPLKEIYNIEQIYSNNGKNFKQLHIIISQVKSWLRTIPTHVSKGHIQSYFDEFCFRINRSQLKSSIFHKTISIMVDSDPIFQNQIKQKLNV